MPSQQFDNDDNPEHNQTPLGRPRAQFDHELAIDLLRKGKHYQEIADACEVSKATVWRFLKGVAEETRSAAHAVPPTPMPAVKANGHYATVDSTTATPKPQQQPSAGPWEKFQPTREQAFLYFSRRLPKERLAKRDSMNVRVRCPFHDDQTPSMAINLRDGTWFCHACGFGGGLIGFERKLTHKPDAECWAAINAIIGRPERTAPIMKSVIIAEYDYHNADGTHAFQTVRLEPKDFRQRHRGSKGEWVWNLKGVTQVPFNLPRVITSNVDLIVEGETCAIAAQQAAAHFPDKDGAIRYAATTSPMGAGKWLPEFGAYFSGKECFVIPDNDEPGRKHALQVCANVAPFASAVHLVELPGLPEKGDIVDYLKVQTPEELFRFMQTVGRWTPPADPIKPRSTATRTGFELVGIGELLSRPEIPPDYLVNEMLIRGTVSVVVAKPKVGKSTYARGLCLAVAKGTSFLGRDTRQGSCIYLALEERAEEITADFRAMGADGTEPIEVHAAPAPAEAIPALIELVRKQHPALVVIDPLFRVTKIRDEKAYAEVYAALGPFIDLAREMNVHILMTHHSGKSMKADAIDSPLGSTAIGGAAATIIVLKKGESYRTVQTVTRIGPAMPETVLSFDPGTRVLSIGGTKEDVDRVQVETEIADYLSAEGAKLQRDIDDHVEGKTKTKRRALLSMVENKLVTRTGSGKKGDPFIYLFPCSPDSVGTREQECGKGPETGASIDPILVPENEQSPVLVPQNSDGKEQAVSEPGKSPEESPDGEWL